MAAGLMTAAQVRVRFGLGVTAFWTREKRGEFNHLMVTRPVGKWKYSAALVEKFLAGESTAKFGAGKLAQRAS